MKNKVVSVLATLITWAIQFFIIWMTLLLFTLFFGPEYVREHSYAFATATFLFGLFAYLLIVDHVERFLLKFKLNSDFLVFYLGLPKVNMAVCNERSSYPRSGTLWSRKFNSKNYRFAKRKRQKK